MFFCGCFGGCGETSARPDRKRSSVLCAVRVVQQGKVFAYLAGLVLTSDRSNEWAVSG